VDPFQVTASALFYAPTAGAWDSWLPAVGSCQISPVRTPLASTFLNVGDHVYLEYGSSLSHVLSRQSDSAGSSYLSSGLTKDDYVTNASFDLVVPSGGDIDSFESTDALLTTQGFDAFTPLNILYDDPQAFPNVSASNFSMTWSPTGVGDAIVVELGVYAQNGTMLYDAVCVSSDSGSMTIPSTVFSSASSGNLLGIWFYRLVSNESIIDANGSTLEAYSSYGVMGTGTLVP
jgi:hypothetical protein